MKFLVITITALASVAAAQPYSTSSTAYEPTETNTDGYEPTETATDIYEPTETATDIYEPIETRPPTHSCTYPPKPCCTDSKEPCKPECPTRCPKPCPKSCPKPGTCKPGTYQCTVNRKSGNCGWIVCNINGKWEYGGDCPSGKTCKLDRLGQGATCV